VGTKNLIESNKATDGHFFLLQCVQNSVNFLTSEYFCLLGYRVEMHGDEPQGLNVRLHKVRIIRNHVIERKGSYQSAISRPASTLRIRMLWRI